MAGGTTWYAKAGKEGEVGAGRWSSWFPQEGVTGVLKGWQGSRVCCSPVRKHRPGDNHTCRIKEKVTHYTC